MILKTLVENKKVSSDFKSKHGLCFYIETSDHKILFDLGKDGLFLENARKMEVDISKVDTVIISHGHIDHGGALKIFLENNKIAKIYIRENAFDKHYAKILGIKINVGLNDSLKNHPQVIKVGKMITLDKELTLFSDIEERECFSSSNSTLYADIENKILKDDFSHEQSLIISENNKLTLIAGCSHTGIVNIKSKAEHIVKKSIDYVIGGFHLYNPISKKTESDELIQKIAKRLEGSQTQYYTCHCTGDKAFIKMGKVLGEKLNYLATGSEVEI